MVSHVVSYSTHFSFLFKALVLKLANPSKTFTQPLQYAQMDSVTFYFADIFLLSQLGSYSMGRS